MTDFVKDFPEKVATNVVRYLRAHPSLVAESVRAFLTELQDLESFGPVIVAFGTDAHSLIRENVPGDSYSRLIKLPHYSAWTSKERYREDVSRQLDSVGTRGTGDGSQRDVPRS